jgi:two-component system response regulator QseB
MRLLVVEDDPMIGRALQTGLQQVGYTVDWVTDGVAALAAATAEDYALAVLDLGLPRVDGLRVLSDLRKRRCGLPIIIVTARDARTDRIRGLDLGADDYLVKPFDLDELAARIRAVLRRHQGRSEPMLEHGAIRLDPAGRRVTLRRRPVDLTAREYGLLLALMERPNAVLSRQALENQLYGWDESVGSNAVEVHIHNLRRKLGQAAIENVRGQGYRLGLIE